MPDFQAFKLPSAPIRQALNVFEEDDKDIPSTSGHPQPSVQDLEVRAWTLTDKTFKLGLCILRSVFGTMLTLIRR